MEDPLRFRLENQLLTGGTSHAKFSFGVSKWRPRHSGCWRRRTLARERVTCVTNRRCPTLPPTAIEPAVEKDPPLGKEVRMEKAD